MTYPRKLLGVLRRETREPEIIVLTGMRRVGKTTLYRMLFDEIKSDNKVFLDLENPVDQKIFEEEDYNNIWSNLKEVGVSVQKRAYIFIDEIQAMPNVVKPIKYLYDHYQVKFFLTGSSSFYLKNLFPESLAGRKLVFELYPLDFEEALIFKQKGSKIDKNFKDKNKSKNRIRYEKLKSVYEEYLKYGGFPQVVLEESRIKKEWQLRDVFKSYFEKEVKGLADFKTTAAFRDLMLLIMQRSGSKLEITKLASEVGVSRETVYSYLAFLEGTYFISLIRPWSRSVDREVSGSRKVYGCDTGLVRQFSQVTEGSLLETAVYHNLRKYGKISYYQRRSGGEIDFVVNQQLGIEVKQRGGKSDLVRLRRMGETLGLAESYVVTKEFKADDGFIPALEI